MSANHSPTNFMLGLWNEYHQIPREYGNPDSYKVAADWLRGYGPVEDWGCGTRAAEKYLVPSRYAGIDGSGRFPDVLADLRGYSSTVHCILIRHVLEHNFEWAKILGNALQSFRNRMALVMFMQPEEPERLASIEFGIPNIHVSRERLSQMLTPTLKEIKECGTDTCYLLEKTGCTT